MLGLSDAVVVGAMGSLTTVIVAAIGAGLLKRKGVFKSVASIERGVNHIGPGEPPLIEQVRVIKRGLDETREILIDQTAWMQDGMTRIGHEVGVTLPPSPVAHYKSHEDRSQLHAGEHHP